MPAPQRREVYLAIGRITIECPRLMTDIELAAVLAAFVETVRAPPPSSISVKPVQRSARLWLTGCSKLPDRSDAAGTVTAAGADT